MLFALAWRKAGNKKIIPFYIFMAGGVYLFELIVYILLDSYVYKPGVFDDPFFDSTFGSSISNGLIVPSAAVFIAAYGLGFRRILLFAAGFMAVEELFLYLGIYEHHWWRSAYTGIGLVFFFCLGKRLWLKIRFGFDPFLFRLFVLYFIDVAAQGTVIFYYIVLFRQLDYRPGWFGEPSKDTVAFATSYVHLDSVLFALAVASRAHWIWKAVLIAALACFSLLLVRVGMMYISGYGTIAVMTVLQLGLLLLLGYFHRILSLKIG